MVEIIFCGKNCYQNRDSLLERVQNSDSSTALCGQKENLKHRRVAIFSSAFRLFISEESKSRIKFILLDYQEIFLRELAEKRRNRIPLQRCAKRHCPSGVKESQHNYETEIEQFVPQRTNYENGQSLIYRKSGNGHIKACIHELEF